MDFDLSEEQRIFVTSARRFLEAECPKQMVRESIEDDTGHLPDLWRKIADMGWLGITIPEAYGGSEGTFMDLLLLTEEMGRALLPGPFLTSTVLAAGAILFGGDEEQKKQHLTKIADGSAIYTLGFPETACGPDPLGVSVKAVAGEKNFIISGSMEFVPYAHVADCIVCAAATGNVKKSEGDLTLFLVDTQTEGVRIDPQKTITGDRPCKVGFSDVVISGENTIGAVVGAGPLLEKLMFEAAVAECGWMVGGARWVLETAVAYAKQRVQFGAPIGSFQAIQHKCADMLTLVDGAAFITYHAAWAVTEDEPDKYQIASAAKAWCSDMVNRVADEGIQILGGIGFTLEHDMQLYYRRARASDAAYGDSHYHREKLADMMGI